MSTYNKRPVPVVKEQLLSLQDSSFGKDPNAVVSIHHYHLNLREHNIRQQTTAFISPKAEIVYKT